MKKKSYSWREYNKLVADLARQITNSGWRPDYIVGITRGGLPAAVMLSHYFGVPMHSLNASFRDNDIGPESNLWMAEDAFGYPKKEKFIEDSEDLGAVLDAASTLLEEGDNYKQILIVDDINDTGATLNWIMDDWQSGCLPNHEDWEHVWGSNVKFAVVIDNLASKCKVKMDFVGEEINKAEDDVWIEFPYEAWWRL
jgi:hypoxanthine phosphoribosyltransferase